MRIHPRHAERIGNQTGMLAARTAKDGQRVFGDVMPARDRNLLDRIGHVLDRDVDKTFDHGFGRGRRHAGRACDLVGERGKACAHDRDIERCIAIGAEHLWKMRGLQFAEHDVRIRHRQRSAAPVTRRPGVGAGRVGADAIPCAVEMQDRATARCHGMDREHRRAHAHTGDLGVERAFERGQITPGKMRNIG